MRKIIRGLALGIALTVYGKEEETDTLMEQMTRDHDPNFLHYGEMYDLALSIQGHNQRQGSTWVYWNMIPLCCHRI